jgi:hypothetical protein
VAWGVVWFRALTTLTFRPPTPFEAGVHGPAAAGTTYSYPPPSTLAGALAFVAFRRRLCTPPAGGREFDDVRGCLRGLLGGEPNLRAGLLAREAGGRLELYAYTGSRRLVEAGCLLNSLRGLPREGTRAREELERRLEACGSLRVGARARYGVGLERGSKAASPGMLYSLERLAYTTAHPVLLASPAPEGLREHVRLGGKGGLAMVESGPSIDPLGVLARIEERRRAWAALLIAPALLEPSKLPSPGVGPVEASDPDWAGRLAEALLPRECGGSEAVLLHAPRNEWALATTTPGWSLASGRPRMPVLAVPPGSLILVRDAGDECARAIALRGLGDHSDLGWGTAAVAPL